ncbi:MAG: prenyltransferase/squalene oxidase repeat-containing protein [Armatimonadota bacterium]
MISYLTLLEGVLRTGLEKVSPALAQAQADYALSLQQGDGGFPGRLGGSDLYYTDFALRLLALIAPETPTLSRTGAWLSRAPRPSNLVQCFNLLNSRRLLALCDQEATVDEAAVRQTLRRQSLCDGGFARPGGVTPSAYQTFLAALCYEMLEEPMPQAEAAIGAVASLQGRDGGFREQLSESVEQTNATAAAVSFLLLEETLTEQQARRAVGFMTKLQAKDGGFLAHPAAPYGDLLSTFTALATLAGLDGFERTNLSAAARFIRATARPGGGFKAAPADTNADLEYTYYGVGCLALLCAAVG